MVFQVFFLVDFAERKSFQRFPNHMVVRQGTAGCHQNGISLPEFCFHTWLRKSGISGCKWQDNLDAVGFRFIDGHGTAPGAGSGRFASGLQKGKPAARQAIAHCAGFQCVR